MKSLRIIRHFSRKKENQEGKTFIIPFHGQTISIIKHKDKGFLVPLKQLCENLGVSWKAQRKRIKEDIVLGATASVTEATASDGKSYDTLTLPLEFLNGFLFTISDKRLKNKQTREKLILYKAECYKVLFEYFDKGFALNTERLKEPSRKEALVREVKKAVSPLPFKSEALQYTFLAEQNIQYGRKVLRHSLKAYFDLIREVKPDLEFKTLKRYFSIIAKPGDKSLVSIKGLKGRQNLYNAKLFRDHFLSLPLDLRESLGSLGYIDIYKEVKEFLIRNPDDYCFEGDRGSISLYSDLLFEAICEVRQESFLNLSNIVYVALCSNGNYYVGSHTVTLKDRFSNHSLVIEKNFHSFLFLMQCDPAIGVREVEHAIFHKLAKTTLRSYEAFEKCGPVGFSSKLDTLVSSITDIYKSRKGLLHFIDASIVLKATDWIKGLPSSPTC